jgi:hypothetical protein
MSDQHVYCVDRANFHGTEFIVTKYRRVWPLGFELGYYRIFPVAGTYVSALRDTNIRAVIESSFRELYRKISSTLGKGYLTRSK